MRSKPNKLYKESMKQNVGSWKNEQDQQTLSQYDKQRREQTQINKIRDEKGDIITNTNEIQKTIRQYFETYIQVNWKI
jgi:hypothetical protein